MIITANGYPLRVALVSNSSTAALCELLSGGEVTVDLSDYGGFEKVGALPVGLPTNDERITTQPGDVILYQGNQITIYYGTNTWTFTRLGRIEGVAGDELKRILGPGDVTATLSLNERQ